MSRLSMQHISVMSVQYWHYSFDYFLNSMEQCGLKNIEFWAGAPHYCFDDHETRAEASQKITAMRRQIEARGMRMIMYTPEQLNYPVNIAGRDPAYRRKSLNYFIRAMEDALEFGCPRVFITSGWGLRDEPREEAWKRSVESLALLSRQATEKGVTLVIEQLQPYESNLLVTGADMARMVSEVDSSALQCCVDLVAMAVSGERLQPFFDRLGPRVQHIHFADGSPSGHFILGDGHLPLLEYLKILEANDYMGYLTLEINDAIYWENPHDSIARSAAYLRRFLPEA
ncbi:MAG TPA: TIM barrel protein [Anaerolineaceae bacterium]|nr:TIM barrel protein [Anaerolineaceae bacterium]HPN51759.1 TIM barrel protein [Anaerolineaceae bacterium]